MTPVPDGLPVSEVGLIDVERRELIGSFMSGSPAHDESARIQDLNRRRMAISMPKELDEARELLAQNAAVG